MRRQITFGRRRAPVAPAPDPAVKTSAEVARQALDLINAERERIIQALTSSVAAPVPALSALASASIKAADAFSKWTQVAENALGWIPESGLGLVDIKRHHEIEQATGLTLHVYFQGEDVTNRCVWANDRTRTILLYDHTADGKKYIVNGKAVQGTYSGLVEFKLEPR